MIILKINLHLNVFCISLACTFQTLVFFADPRLPVFRRRAQNKWSHYWAVVLHNSINMYKDSQLTSFMSKPDKKPRHSISLLLATDVEVSYENAFRTKHQFLANCFSFCS